MNIIKTLNHFWRKPESKPIQQSAAPVNEKESEEVSKLKSEIVKAKEVIAAWRSEAEKLKDELTKMSDVVSDLKGENESLRKQLKEASSNSRKLLKSNNSLRQFKRDTMEALGNIDLNSFRLQNCKRKCDSCKNEHLDCRKISVCAIPKQ